MKKYLSEKEEFYVLNHLEENKTLLMSLGKIPAPSYHEFQRAKYCKDWLELQGAQGVYIDDVYNVIYPLHCDEDNDIVVFMAHSDIAFCDQEDIEIVQKGHRLYGAGIGDDTANVVNLLMTMKYVIQQQLNPSLGLLFVINSCEEGLGNSRGCQKIFEQYHSRIKEFISFDGYLNECTNSAVGSRRYKITVNCEGGHSYADFGKDNAIAIIAKMIVDLDHISLPQEDKVTYNFGMIEGGTTINAIASQASLLYEFRSCQQTCLEDMETHLQNILTKYKEKYKIQIETLGIRPGNGPIDHEKLMQMTNRNIDIIQHYYPSTVNICAYTTDSNIPLSYGICANTIGTIIGGNAHTYHEWIDLESIGIGFKVAMAIVLQYFQ